MVIGIGRHSANFTVGFTILFDSQQAFDAAVAIDKVGLTIGGNWPKRKSNVTASFLYGSAIRVSCAWIDVLYIGVYF